MISSHSSWNTTHNMIQKSWTKVNFICSQLDSNVLYDTLQSTCKWNLVIFTINVQLKIGLNSRLKSRYKWETTLKRYVTIHVQVKTCLYGTLQSTWKWKSAFTIRYVPRTSGSAFNSDTNIRIQCNSFLVIAHNEV